MKQFILNYTGTKFLESKKLDTLNIDYDKFDTIIEPFGGSFGFSRYLWSEKNLKNKKFIVYDVDKELIDFYNHVKNLLINNKFQEFIDEYNKIQDTINEKYVDIEKKYVCGADQKYLRSFINDIENKYLLYMTKHNVLNCVLKKSVKKEKLDFLDMIVKTEFINKQFEEIDITSFDKEKTLIYLDPPYMMTDNTTYKCKFGTDELNNIFQQIFKLLDENNTIFVHQHNFLLDYILKKKMLLSYDKIYSATKRKTMHNVYGNFF
jgi:site-specific DNA-adenine methylase